MNPHESRHWTERTKWMKKNQKTQPQPLKPVERRPSLGMKMDSSGSNTSQGMEIPAQQRRMSESSMASSQGSMSTSPTTDLKNMMSGMKTAQQKPLQPPMQQQQQRRGSRFSDNDMHMSF